MMIGRTLRLLTLVVTLLPRLPPFRPPKTRGGPACYYDTGGMRRTHLRGYENILKWQSVHVGAFNLSLILRRAPADNAAGMEKPRRQASPVSFCCLHGARIRIGSA